MSEILTVTLNPTVDLSTSAARVVPGPKLRCAPPLSHPGGGGLNVARAIRFLGGNATAFAALAGPAGGRLTALLAHEGIALVPYKAPGDTRESFSVTDRRNGKQYRFVLPGPTWRREDSEAVLQIVTASARPRGLVVMSGSEPPGIVPGFCERLKKGLPEAARLILDTSGEALRRVVERPCGLFVLRMDRDEAEDLSGRRLGRMSDMAAFARGLVGRGVAEVVIIARGAPGNLLVSADRKLHCARPVTEVVSAIGAGDSFVGGFTLALSRGQDLAQALRLGTAAAAAAVMTEATELCSLAETERQLRDCALIEL